MRYTKKTGPTFRPLDEQIEKREYACEDCFDEALSDCGIYSGLVSPQTLNDIRDRFDENYRIEFTTAHIEHEDRIKPLKGGRFDLARGYFL